jgi:hypothetical protein
MAQRWSTDTCAANAVVEHSRMIPCSCDNAKENQLRIANPPYQLHLGDDSRLTNQRSAKHRMINKLSKVANWTIGFCTQLQCRLGRFVASLVDPIRPVSSLQDGLSVGKPLEAKPCTGFQR